MKCANCGNSDKKTLHDEGDTIYCSVCCHRTLVATGKDDLIKCPFCGRMRDRKAANCLWCNNSLDSQPGPSKKEFNEINEALKEFDASLDPSNKRYWNIRP